ncbi:MAG: cell surface protein SprA [Cytophagales bacterium]|nr:cell surface protein SprA [Cytophagales bacterium]
MSFYHNNTTKWSLLICMACILGMAASSRPTGMRNMLIKTILHADSLTKDTTDKTRYKPSKKPTYKAKDRYGDEYSNGKKRSGFANKPPSSVKTEVEIDESGKFYKIDEKIGQDDYRPGSTMTFEQYRKHQQKNTAKNFYKQKAKEKDEKSTTSNRSLVPRIYMSPTMDRIFGGNYVDVKLNGFVLLDFGYRIQTIESPSTPVNLRTQGGFYFDQQISLNAQAKIGERLKITINQDTKSQFDFDNNVKVEYSSLETDIIQKVELGNVNMPLNSSLIQGANNLFGVKAQLRFGRLYQTWIIANQRGTNQSTKIQGGAQGRNFEIRADNYEDNRHYFLGQFFRNNYEKSLSTLPVISSGVIVTRVEVWVTNRNNTTNTLRNVAAFMDMGEPNPYNNQKISPYLVPNANDNYSNTLYRDLRTAISGQDSLISIADNMPTLLSQPPFNLENGNDYEIMRSCRRLNENEYKFHPQLGYISLLQPIGRDDVLGVAYEYSYLGQTYKVGELQEDYGSRSTRQVAFVKLLRPSTIRTNIPMWDLQMKNIYSLNSTGVSRENFQLRVVYRDDFKQLNIPSISEGKVYNEDAITDKGINGRPLIDVMGLDKLNMSNDPQPDGNFDFVDSPSSSAISNTNPAFNNVGQNNNQNNPNNPNQNNNINPNNPNANFNNNMPTNQNKIVAITIDPQTGRVIFPVLEPFGQNLKSAFGSDTVNRPDLINKYVYNELYRQTKADALQLSNKNKFFIVGRMQSSSSDEIQLQGFNIQPGTVKVFSGSQRLIEGTDYTIDYSLGKLKVINPAYLIPGQEVRVDYEKNDVFQVRQRNFMGTRWDYKLSKDIAFGGTFLRLAERPMVSRVAIGDEPLENMIFGVDATYKSDVPIVTKIIDKLPVIQTKETSTLQVNGEFAKLITGAPTLNDKDNDGGTFYIDDFENTSIPFRLDNTPALSWKLAATPRGLEGIGYSNSNILPSGYRRAKMAWYVVDLSFYNSSQNIPGVSAEDKQNYYVKPVFSKSLFPNRDLQNNIQTNELIFDVAYYPEERGPYNYNTDLNTDGTLKNPQNNWGGITRAVNNYDTDFDNQNYQYLEFWVMDPFIKGDKGKIIDGRKNKNNETGGKLIFNLGSISEDVMKDGRHAFEQGLPNSAQRPHPNTEPTPWGYVTNQQYITNAFGAEPGARANQDVGLDGLNDDNEKAFHADYLQNIRAKVADPKALQEIENDPSGDNFDFYFSTKNNEKNAKILERYKYYNNVQGNSSDNNDPNLNTTNSATNVPDNEDINQNNTLNDVEAYFKYEIDMRPGRLQAGSGYVINETEEQLVTSDGTPTGEKVKWYLFRVPLREGYEKVGNIENFKSIRFLRMYMTGWAEPVVMRFAQMQLVSSQWRPYQGDLSSKGLKEIIEPDDKVFTVSTISVEENQNSSATYGSKYTFPPGFQRDRDLNSLIIRRQNESSLRLCVDNLQDDDGRAVFKNVNNLNLINYETLRMFVHAEGDPTQIKDKDLTVFIRFGSDFTDNYYEIERPLILSPPGATDANEVWLNSNRFDISLDKLWSLKLERDRAEYDGQTSKFSVFPAYRKTDMQMIYIRGNPVYTNLQTIMIGIRNPRNDGNTKSICIWVNELRVSGIKSEDGWAALAKANLKMADLGNLTGSIKYTSSGFGGLDQKISQRLLENTTEMAANTNLQMDKFIPKNDKIGIRLPVYASIEKKNITPKYDPLNADVPIDSSINNKPERIRNNYRNVVEDNTTRRNISLTNIQKVKTKKGAKSYIFDIENFALTFSYSDITRTNVYLAEYLSKNYRGALGWAYGPKPPTIEPFKKANFLSGGYFKLIKDVNLIPFPNSLSARGELDRTIIKTQYGAGIEDGRHIIEGIRPNYEKRFLFNRNFAVGWALTKSISVNYTASTQAIVDEPFNGPITDEVYVRDPAGRTKKDIVLDNIFKGGRIKTFNQQVNVTYKVPLDKIPLINWTSADARYSAGYTWNAGPVGGIFDTLKFGNTAQNTRDLTLNARADFQRLYNKWKPLGDFISTAPRKPPPPPNPKDTALQKKPREYNGFRALARLIFMTKSVNATYQRTEGTVLPGYLGFTRHFGLDSYEGSLDTRFLPFVLGDQRQDVYKQQDFANQYLSKNRLQSNPIQQNFTENITGRANLEPFRDFRVQLDARITNTLSYNEFYRYNTTVSAFEVQNPYHAGTYSISFLAIETFFTPDRADNSNPTFDRMEDYRTPIIKRFTADNPNITEQNKYVYDTSSQDVIINAFIAAYANRDPNKMELRNFPRIPMPNWRVDYAGLPNVFPAIKKLFPSISITHSYSATYNTLSYTSKGGYKYDELHISKFQNNNYPYLPQDTLLNGNVRLNPIDIINTVSIVEKFAPLIGFNFKTKNNMTFRIEYRMDRTLDLGIQNRTLRELRNNDLTVGYGYTKAGMVLPFKYQGREIILKNDVTMRIDLTRRETITIQRLLDGNSTVVAGQEVFQIRPSVGYQVNTRLSITSYFEYNLTRPKISTAFPITRFSFGVQIRYSLS